ncbi:MAG: hypothetical protein FJX77_14240 [Armatimonadetes bacterium]|nr:hypothetical protein [Armatimonadota bacterium]
MPEGMGHKAATADPGAGRERVDPVLAELEGRYVSLKAELDSVSREIRSVLTAAEGCPSCSGLGYRLVRGGLYGETQRVACPCRNREAGARR